MICLIVLLFSLVSVSHLTNLKPNPGTEFVRVYNFGFGDPNGILGIKKMTVKLADEKFCQISCDHKSLFMGGTVSSYGSPVYLPRNFDFTMNYVSSNPHPIFPGIMIEIRSEEFRVIGFSGTKVVRIRGIDKAPCSIEGNLVNLIEARDGDEFQIIGPFGQTDAVISLTLGMVKDTTLEGEDLAELQFKFNAITEYKLSDKRPIVETVPSVPLKQGSHRFKWFVDEKERSFLPKVTYPNGIMEFTESTIVFTDKFSNFTTRVELVENMLQVRVDEGSLFMVAIKSVAFMLNGEVVPGKNQFLSKGTSSIPVKKGDRVIILNVSRRSNDIASNLRLPEAMKELIEQLENHNLMDDIRIIAYIVENKAVSNFQNTKPTNNNNNNIFQNDENFNSKSSQHLETNLSQSPKNSSSKSNSNVEFVHVYDLGLDDSKGELGITKITIKSPNKQLPGIICDQKSLYADNIYRAPFGLKYTPQSYEITLKHMAYDPFMTSFGLAIAPDRNELWVKGPNNTTISRIRGSDKISYDINGSNIIYVKVNDGDEVQITDPYELTDTIVCLKLGMVRKKALEEKDFKDLNSKFDGITEYNLSYEKPIVKEISSTPLNIKGLRLKWFADEKTRSLLPNVSYSNGTLKFTESALVFSGNSPNSATLIKLSGDNLQVKIYENSPFSVLIRSKNISSKGGNTSERYRFITKQTSKPSPIKVKENDEIFIFNFPQERNRIISKSVFPKTIKELIEQLQMHSMADSIYIVAQIAQNILVPEIQETKSMKNISNANNTATFKNNKKSSTVEKPKSKSKSSQHIKPKKLNDTLFSKEPKKGINNEKKTDFNFDKKTRTLETILPIDSPSKVKISEQTIAKPNDQTLEIGNNNHEIENSNHEIENNVHEIDPVDDEISDRLEKVVISQPRKHMLKRSISTPNLREKARFYTLSNINILKQTNLEELD